MSDPNVHTALRIIAGHCPKCGLCIAVGNNGQTWPLASCDRCGWENVTTALVNRVRFDVGWRVSDEHGPERELRT